ncbi:MAG TPA: L-dopachrome tautomerase-related protein [Geobacteraceae bacterium]
MTNPVSYVAAPPVMRGALFEYPVFSDQVTGIAVSREGRIFVNFPRWDKDPLYSVAEVLPGGVLRPYPDADWNRWGKDEKGHPGAHFVCIQSVFVDAGNRLWILDAASPGFKGVVPGGSKLLQVSLATNRVERVIPFDATTATPRSYLNDVRIDPRGDVAYITDSGAGAIVVVDLKNGTARRLLSDHPSTKAEPGYVPVIEGKELRDEQGRVPQIHADGLAVDTEGEYLYFHALTARTLYRIKTAFLRDAALPEAQLGQHVERLAATGAVDGMVMDGDDNLYLAVLEENAVKRYRPDGTMATIVRDEHIHWPDSMAISYDNFLYFTASQIERMPRFNHGTDLRTPPFSYFKIWLK